MEFSSKEADFAIIGSDDDNVPVTSIQQPQSANCAISTDSYGFIITTCTANGTAVFIDNDTSTHESLVLPRLTPQNFTAPRSGIAERDFSNGKLIIALIGLCVTSQLAYTQLRRQLTRRDNFQLFALCMAFGYLINCIDTILKDGLARLVLHRDLLELTESPFLISRFFIGSATSYFLVCMALDKLLFLKHGAPYRQRVLTRARTKLFIGVALFAAALAVLPLLLTEYLPAKTWHARQWLNMIFMIVWFCLQDLIPIGLCCAANLQLACLAIAVSADEQAFNKAADAIGVLPSGSRTSNNFLEQQKNAAQLRRPSYIQKQHGHVRNSTWITLMLINLNTLIFSTSWPVSNLITIICNVATAPDTYAVGDVVTMKEYIQDKIDDKKPNEFCISPSLLAYQDAAQILYSLRPIFSALIYLVLMPQSRRDWQRYVLPLLTCGKKGGTHIKKPRRRLKVSVFSHSSQQQQAANRWATARMAVGLLAEMEKAKRQRKLMMKEQKRDDSSSSSSNDEDVALPARVAAFRKTKKVRPVLAKLLTVKDAKNVVLPSVPQKQSSL